MCLELLQYDTHILHPLGVRKFHIGTENMGILSNNCLCFLFPLIYGHHGTFTDEQQLRTVHGIFTDLRTYDNYGHFTEHSRNFHGLTDERQLRTFRGTFTDLRTNGSYGHFTEYSRILNVTELLENNHGINWS